MLLRLTALLALLALLGTSVPSAAQDIRGLEVCTAEKAMDRRTSCLQSNVEFLQHAMDKQRRDLQGRLDAASKEAAAQKAELAAIRAELAKVQAELADMKKAKPEKK